MVLHQTEPGGSVTWVVLRVDGSRSLPYWVVVCQVLKLVSRRRVRASVRGRRNGRHMMRVRWDPGCQSLARDTTTKAVTSGHTACPGSFVPAAGHVWTAPCWQGFSERCCTAGRSCHVSGLLMRHCFMAAGHNALRGSGPGHKHALVWRCGTNGLSRSSGRLAWVRYSFVALSNFVSGDFPRVFVALPYAADIPRRRPPELP